MENNIIYASENKVLLTPYGVAKQVVLGKSKAIINGEILDIEYTKDNVIEVTPIEMSDGIYYARSTSYPELVTELIRIKYSLDDELALYANSRIGDLKGELLFLEWRSYCKYKAKLIYE